MTLIAMIFSFVVTCVLLFGPIGFLKRRPVRKPGRILSTLLIVIPCAWIFWGCTVSKIIFTPDDELCSAARHDNRMEARILLWRGANPNAIVDKKFRALESAVSAGHTEMVRLLLDHGGEANQAADIWGDDSLLASAAYRDCPEIVKLLLERGANPEKGSDTFKPLVMAVGRGNLKCAEILLAHGANPNVDTGYNWSVLDYVRRFSPEENRADLEKLLLKYHAVSHRPASR